jgi:hypothetical protein
MKKLAILIISLLMPINTNAYTILTDTNNLSKIDITDSNNNLHLEWYARLKSDGGNYMHCVPKDTPKYTNEELLKIYKYMGPGFVFTEEGSYTVINGTQMHKLNGRLDAWMVYNESWMYPRFDAYVSFDTTRLWREHGTVLSDEQIDWSVKTLAAEGYYSDVVVHCRRYKNAEKSNIDHALENDNVSGAVMEFVPRLHHIDTIKAPEFITKVLHENKMVFLLINTESGYDYRNDMKSLIIELRARVGKLLYHQDLFIIVANYGRAAEWFGDGNSIEGTIKDLKEQPEWIGNENWIDFTTIKQDNSSNKGCFINTLIVK